MKIPRTDPRANHIATTTSVDRDRLEEFVRTKHQWVLATTRADGRPQMSLVTGGMIADGRLAISSYPERAKVGNVRRDGAVSVLVLGDDFGSAWVQIDGAATVVDMPDAADALVEYYRSISGEHPDWDEYRRAMTEQGKCVILVEPTRWGPISTGGFPASLFDDEG
ncbi:MAG: PPOX class F420-dependent oxidoreductase [Acidimicrobiia bacterium]